MIDYKLIGRRIQQFREAAGLTQDAVSESAEITTVYLSKIENGHVNPSLEALNRICLAIHCDLSEILSDTTPYADRYQNETVIRLFRACSPAVKPIALELLESLSKIE